MSASISVLVGHSPDARADRSVSSERDREIAQILLLPRVDREPTTLIDAFNKMPSFFANVRPSQPKSQMATLTAELVDDSKERWLARKAQGKPE